jgi:hypothetical protein
MMKLFITIAIIFLISSISFSQSRENNIEREVSKGNEDIPAHTKKLQPDSDYPIRDALAPIPVLVPWFPGNDSGSGSAGYRDYIDMIAEHTDYTVIGAKTAVGEELTDAMKKDLRDVVAYAKHKGIGVSMNAYFAWGAIDEFALKYPCEIQERLECLELDLQASGLVEVKASGKLLRAYSYSRLEGEITAGTIKDITNSCDGQEIISIPCSKKTAGKKACLMFTQKIAHPALFAPHAVEAQEKIIKMAAEMGFAGAFIDEGGLNSGLNGNPDGDYYWYSLPMAEIYSG